MWDLTGWIISSDPRRLVLEATMDGPITPKKVSDKKDIRMEYVSRSLSELSERNLVECLNPEAHKGKLYKITGKGEDVISKIDENGL